jgi:hypothetical protein
VIFFMDLAPFFSTVGPAPISRCRSSVRSDRTLDHPPRGASATAPQNLDPCRASGKLKWAAIAAFLGAGSVLR